VWELLARQATRDPAAPVLYSRTRALILKNATTAAPLVQNRHRFPAGQHLLGKGFEVPDLLE